MKVADFDYYLPEQLIAQTPVEPRDAARLLVLHRENGAMEHRIFRDIGEYLHSGDCLVVNDTRVIPARLLGRKQTGGEVEVFLLRPVDATRWEALVRPGKRVRVGTEVLFGEGQLRGRAVEATPDGGRIIEFDWQGDFNEVLAQVGQVPLPPYITAPLEDKERYQTVYNAVRGSVAAPTAGLHFTPELLQSLTKSGVKLARLTLHVGLGTFRPVKVEEVEEHTMHSEYYEVSEEAASIIAETKRAGGRVIAVGTTSCRTLETVGQEGEMRSGRGWTDIFIYPGYRFKIVDALITNFHLPRSTLMMLVSALAGREAIMGAYQEAVDHQYRFFSFGDAMFIV